MKALIILNVRDCSIEDLYDANYVRLYTTDGDTIDWDGGFKIMPIPEKKEEISIDDTYIKNNFKETISLEKVIEKARTQGYNYCIDEILNGVDDE